MTFVRRLFLVVFVIAAPLVLTAGLYFGTNYFLTATHRVVDPQVPIYAAYVELAVFFLWAFVEARERW